MHTSATFSALALVFALAAGCGDPEHCRFNPNDCAGGVGGPCRSNDDCDDGICCTEGANCRGGMCTYSCASSADCPEDMACEHNVCFFRCTSNTDCAAGMSCEHGSTVCEWP